ncbi:glycosyltransferase [Vreelandella nanhaiensis]|uniref:Glycosyltransferase n=1 Tax=Vreelandella nanhaiensis TaxID=1258546 RepID=A0A3S0XX44_9GAMM|nr:glycosyltransferase [Halomonas nanhaiensis]RUR32224.1 glycosyltransferase [Halomonas nanhaiensis]
MSSKDLRVACVVPTYNDVLCLTRLLDSLAVQDAEFDLLIVDSSSSDGTTELAKARSPHVVVISSEEFNHGATRQKMVDAYPNYDIYIFLTQDVYLEDKKILNKIKDAFTDPEVAAVCGRQLPHYDANLLAQHARLFNYPDKTQMISKNDISYLGIKAAFISNSFSAYRRCALKHVSGFPEHVILSEDMYVAAKLILADYKLVYLADATCRHSHNYTLIEEFGRYFDIGVFHARESWIQKEFGGVRGEGVKYMMSELKFLGVNNFHLWPFAILRNALKFLAFKLGEYEAYLPISIKRKIGMHKRYWNGPFAKEGPSQCS